MGMELEDLLPLLQQMSAQRFAPRSLEALAQEVERSPTHFQRTFRRLVGESPKKYGRRLQLESGAMLLVTTERSVLDVALDVGFDSHEGFTRAFRAHFNETPRAFRAAHGAGLDGEHARLIQKYGPCVGLFRAELRSRESRPMTYEISKLDREPETLLVQSGTCTHEEIAATLATLLPAVFGHCGANGVQMMGPPTTVYTTWGAGTVSMSAGMPVASGTKGEGPVETFAYPGGATLSVIHTGPYETLHEAHAALERYAHENSMTANGPIREIYLTDPGEVPNPEEWQTQLLLPIK